MFINPLSDDILLSRHEKRFVKDVRNPYFRDSTAIMHSSAFRRLKHKAQVFSSPSNDHIATRIEHSLHVGSIAVAITNALEGLKSDLAWAIGLGHDIGHAPFGHSGERVIDKLWVEYDLKHGQTAQKHFEHELNSLRVATKAASGGKGLNLTFAVLDGIVSHCGEDFSHEAAFPSPVAKDLDKITTRSGLIPSTWEGLVVRNADMIAYLGRDAEDAMRMGVITDKDLPKEVTSVLGRTNSEIINTLVNDIVQSSSPEKGIQISKKNLEAIARLKDFNYERIYRSEWRDRFEKNLERMLRLIYTELEEMFDKYGMEKEGYLQERNLLCVGFGNFIADVKTNYLDRGEGRKELIFDYISGMSDGFCQDCAAELLFPDYINQKEFEGRMLKWFDKA